MAYDLERRRDNLRSERVGLRKAIERLLASIALGAGNGMHHEKTRALADLRLRLRGTEREWCELNSLLGDRHRRVGPIRLASAPRPVVRTASRGSTDWPYMTRMMGGR